MMKTLKVVIITMAAVLTMLFGRVVQAQSILITNDGQIVDCSKKALAMLDRDGSLNTIDEEDYPYLRNLECWENGYFSDKQDFNMKIRNVIHNRNDVSHFVLKGHGPNIELEATYDKDGSLIKALLVKIDTAFPCCIYRFILKNGEYEGWAVASNEMVVRDFDPSQTEFKVTMKNGSKEKVLHFENQGNNIAFLANR